MNTWRSSAALACLTLAACGEGLPSFSLDALRPSAPVVRSAPMAFGAVTLTAPQGFCIDPDSLGEEFALMARCDTLGGPPAPGAPLALITASFTALTPDTALPKPDETAAALDLTNVTLTREGENAVSFQAQGAAPLPTLSDTHWRAHVRVGNQLMGLALYAPRGGSALGTEGRALLTGIATETPPS